MSFYELLSQERPPEEAQDRPRKDGLLGSRVLEAGPHRARGGMARGSGGRGQDGGKTEATAFTGVSRGKAGGVGGTRTIGCF